MTISTVEEVANLVLREIGYPRPISDIYEGSRASRAVLDIYSETRDEVLREHNWPFATRDLALAAVSGQTPPAGWLYEYAFPADCIRLRNLKPSSIPNPNFDPAPILFAEWNDNRLSPAAKVILANSSPAIAVYVARITDPSTWEPGFLTTLTSRLGNRLEPLLRGAAKKETDNAEIKAEWASAVSSINPPNDAMPEWLPRSKTSAT